MDVRRATGEELRRTREKRGWSRIHLTTLLPSKIGDRTLLSYENGLRRITVCRFVEICWALGADPAVLLARGLQRARLRPEAAVIHVDLHKLHHDSNNSAAFRTMAQWARNALNEHPDGIMTIEPAAVRNLAFFLGHPHTVLASYLARFTPDDNDTDGGH